MAGASGGTKIITTVAQVQILKINQTNVSSFLLKHFCVLCFYKVIDQNVLLTALHGYQNEKL